MRALFHSFLIAGLVSFAPPALAEKPADMAQIEQAWARGDFVFVREGLAELAQDDTNALALYRYGRVLLEGRGGPLDTGLAIDYLERAATLNNADAATLLGRVYLGRGPQRDAPKAATYLAAAAARGNTEAQYLLGLIYREGDGLPKDVAIAFNWFLAASEEGNKDAQFAVSRAYSRGEGTGLNTAEALRWLTEAAVSGHAEAQFYMGNASAEGQVIQTSMADAVKWYRRSAEQGFVLAQRALGTAYLLGQGQIDTDAAEAERWLLAAAEAGDAGAMSNLAFGYVDGSVLTRDDARAVAWYENASDRGLARATLALGRLYEVGRGVAQDEGKALTLYRQAVDEGSREARQLLGQMVLAGRLDDAVAPHDAVPWVISLLGNSQDAATWLQSQAEAGVRPAQAQYGLWLSQQAGSKDKGFALIAKAAMAGDVQSQFRLGEAHTTGTGVELDYIKAHSWMNIAAASGHAQAADTRDLLNDLMTPDQLAEAQTVAREFFAAARALVPQTQQTTTTQAKP